MRKTPINWSGGVNLFADPTQIRDNQVRLAKNLVPADAGTILGSRPAMKVASELIPGSPFLNIIPLRAQRSALGGVDLVFYDSATDRVRFSSSGSDTVNLTPPTVRNLPISLTTFNGIPYCFTGQGQGYRIVPVAGVPTPEALVFQGVGNANFRPVGGAPVRARMCYWAGREITFSDTNAPLLIRDNSAAGVGTILVAADTSDGITHVQELNTTASGSPTQSVVAVWTTDAMYMLLGEPGETGSPDSLGTLQVTKLTIAAGCVSGATVVQTPYGTLWAGADDVWFLPFGSLPVRVGTNIRPALLNTPPSLRYRWHAAYENGIYRLAIDAPGAGPTEIGGCMHHWLLDMRNGPPQNAESAVWWGPQEYTPAGSSLVGPGTWAFITQDTDQGTLEVQAVQPWSAEDDTGTSRGVSLCTLNANDSRDESTPNFPPNPPRGVTQYEVGDLVVPYDETFGQTQFAVWRCVTAGLTSAEPLPQFNDGVSTGITVGTATFELDPPFLGPRFEPTSFQFGNEIVPELRTKEYVGDATKDKLYDGTEAGYWVNRRGVLQYSALTDIDASSRILVEAGTDTSQSRLDASTSTLQRLWQSRLLTPQTGRRFHAKSLQFVMSHKKVFVVDDTNDVVLFRIGGTDFKVQVTRGEYANIDELLDAVTSSVQSATAATWAVTGGPRVSAVSAPPEPWAIFFDVTASGTIPGWTSEDYRRCARLFALLGVDTNNQHWYTTTPTFAWQSFDGSRVYGKTSPESTRTFRSSFSALNMRVDTFKRGPT